MTIFVGEGLVCIRGERTVFAGLDFALGPGGALVLVGPNGSGKSSLLRLMAGLLRQQRAPAEIMQILAAEERQTQAVYASVARNDPCPCGSGKKFKHCHGRLAA